MNATQATSAGPDAVLALIYLPYASRSVSRVKEFRRCPEHDNLLTWEGRALGVDEFNLVAPKALGVNAATNYGMQPLVKLVRVAGAVPNQQAPGESGEAPVQPKPEPVIDLPEIGVEPIADGFMLVNYSSPEAQYMGTSRVWEADASLVTPFDTAQAARSACQGRLVEKPTQVQEPVFEPAEEETAEAGESADEETAEAPAAADAPKKRGRKPKAKEETAEAPAN